MKPPLTSHTLPKVSRVPSIAACKFSLSHPLPPRSAPPTAEPPASSAGSGMRGVRPLQRLVLLLPQCTASSRATPPASSAGSGVRGVHPCSALFLPPPQVRACGASAPSRVPRSPLALAAHHSPPRSAACPLHWSGFVGHPPLTHTSSSSPEAHRPPAAAPCRLLCWFGCMWGVHSSCVRDPPIPFATKGLVSPGQGRKEVSSSLRR